MNTHRSRTPRVRRRHRCPHRRLASVRTVVLAVTLLATAGCGRGDGADPATDAPTAPETTVDAVAASNPTSTTAAAVAPSVVTHEPRIAVPTASGTGGDPQAPPPSSTTIPTRTADLASIEANLAGLDVLLAPIDVALAAEAEARALGE